MSETVLKKLWTDKLQTHTMQMLEDLDWERVSEIADKIHDNNQDLWGLYVIWLFQ